MNQERWPLWFSAQDALVVGIDVHDFEHVVHVAERVDGLHLMQRRNSVRDGGADDRRHVRVFHQLGAAPVWTEVEGATVFRNSRCRKSTSRRRLIRVSTSSMSPSTSERNTPGRDGSGMICTQSIMSASSGSAASNGMFVSAFNPTCAMPARPMLVTSSGMSTPAFMSAKNARMAQRSAPSALNSVSLNTLPASRPTSAV